MSHNPDGLAHPARGERRLIRALRERLRPDPAGAVPFGDDMAEVPAAGGLLWSVDMLMDGVDFDSTRHAWHDVGRKALAVNLSDCAAMAARPIAALCAVALADRLTFESALELLDGCRACAEEHGCELVGGDTNSWEHPTVIAMTVAGRTENGAAPVLRSGARPGDRLYVSGPVGGSILGRHMRIAPRVELALKIRRELSPSAMIDVSDGLALDLSRVLEASRCGALLDRPLVERAIHADAHELAARDGVPAIDHALHDGEDFELIVATPPSVEPHRARELGLLPLGEVDADSGLRMRTPDGSVRVIEPRGWEHFR